MGFLLNRNRVNVAVSRAQWTAVLIRSEALTAFMPSQPHGVLELGRVHRALPIDGRAKSGRKTRSSSA